MGAWSLTSAVSFSVAGPLSDVFGRRNPILVGQVIIILGCIVASTAHSFANLIAGQALSGFGTGLLFVAYAGVPEMLPNKWRSLGLGILEAGVAIPWYVPSSKQHASVPWIPDLAD
jgi:MFS family permease